MSYELEKPKLKAGGYLAKTSVTNMKHFCNSPVKKKTAYRALLTITYINRTQFYIIN